MAIQSAKYGSELDSSDMYTFSRFDLHLRLGKLWPSLHSRLALAIRTFSSLGSETLREHSNFFNSEIQAISTASFPQEKVTRTPSAQGFP